MKSVSFYRKQMRKSLLNSFKKSRPSIKHKLKFENVPTHYNYDNLKRFSNNTEKR